jgi:hypothetical protein
MTEAAPVRSGLLMDRSRSACGLVQAEKLEHHDDDHDGTDDVENRVHGSYSSDDVR